MRNTTIQFRTAAGPRACDSCAFTASLRGALTIGRGHRYARHVAFPWADGNESDRVVVTNECVACLCERDSTAGVLLANACSTWCCGDVPCALPWNHAGDHSCRRCGQAGRPDGLPPTRAEVMAGE